MCFLIPTWQAFQTDSFKGIQNDAGEERELRTRKWAKNTVTTFMYIYLVMRIKEITFIFTVPGG